MPDNNTNWEQTVIEKGNPLIMGISRDGSGINFAVAVKNAAEIVLNIYEKGQAQPVKRIFLDDSFRTGSVFSVLIKGVNLIGYEYDYTIIDRVYKDPYARYIAGTKEWGIPLGIDKELLRGTIRFEKYDWENDERPKLAFNESVLYKLHVRGFTKHKTSKVSAKGTFKGVMQKADHLKDLGITTVILMPCYEFDEIVMEEFRVSSRSEVEYMLFDEYERYKEEMNNPILTHYEGRNGYESHKNIIPYKINYWGYCDRAFYFAPKASYASSASMASKEFKDMVKKLHSMSIEVIMEFTFSNKNDISFVIDCLRYWYLEYHVDGFKLSRNEIDVDMIAMDPILMGCKLIAESFDEYRIYGNTSPAFNKKNLAMMNVEYMYTARKYLKGDEDQLGDFAYKFRRNPAKVGIVNYITETNGFTLTDLYSYDIKHNDANGENNRDGNDYNYSWNCGFEGPTRKKKIISNRNRQIANALMSLLLSQGAPMLLAGDEFGNSQNGNNNAYCQDNEISWLNWSDLKKNENRYNFVKELIAFRKQNKVFGMNNEARMMDYISCGYPDLSCHGTRAWFPEYTNYSRTLGIMLCDIYAGFNNGDTYSYRPAMHGDRDEALQETSLFYLAFNMHWEQHEFDLPKAPDTHQWTMIMNSSEDCFETVSEVCPDQMRTIVPERTVAVYVAKAVPELVEKKRAEKEAARLAALKAEEERIKAQRAEAARIEAEKREAERKEAERKEAERKEAEIEKKKPAAKKTVKKEAGNKTSAKRSKE